MSDKYEYKIEDGYTIECYCCGSIAPLKQTIRSRAGTPRKKEEFWVCELCASSFALNSELYPRQYDGATLKTIAQVGNVILDKLTDRRQDIK